MAHSTDTVTVRVPGSTSNCGSGFDTLGLALGIHNRITLSRMTGTEAAPERPSDGRASEMVRDAAAAFFSRTGLAPCGFRYRIDGDVPYARGLGSSVTVLAGILAGLDALHASLLGRHAMIGLTAALEGHPDNAGAGILGGFCVSRSDPATGAYVDTIRFPVPPELAFAVVSPAKELLTKDSRGALPADIPYFDAVRSINSAAYLVAALATGDFARLGHAAGDFMHEPYRLPKIPGSREAMAAGVSAGAFTGWLSGSGSSVLCVCDQATAPEVVAAMTRAFTAVGAVSDARILSADNEGLAVE
jgi:homoserine kinase